MITFVFGVLFIAFFSYPAAAYNGCSASKDGNLVVTYEVEDGYKISVKIDTKSKKSAYGQSLKADVSSINIDFIDLNKDGLQDVVIKYIDETGYSPEILINHNNISFVSALPSTSEAFYVNTELEIKDDGIAVRRKSYDLRNIAGETIPELIFYKVFIGADGYRYVVFRYDRQTMRYLLYKKGESFLKD